MNALGVYIFAGGFSVGVREAGFKVLAHLEKGTYGVETFQVNFPLTPVWQHPVTWPLSYIRETLKPDFIYCNPPCAAWSMAGRSLTEGKTSWLKDGRVQCVRDVFMVLREVRPTVLVWESVTQAWTRGRGLIEALTREAHSYGYAVTYLFTSAALHGIPQPRMRFMMFCHKVALDLPFPTTPRRNVQDCLELETQDEGKTWTQGCPIWGLHPMSRSYARLIRGTGPGEDLVSTWKDVISGDHPMDDEAQSPAFMAGRLELRGSGHTFTSAVMEIHPVWNRWVANSEVARMSSYPDDYIWVGDRNLVRAQICQAVLPAVGKYAGDCVREALLRGTAVLPGKTFLVNHIEDRRFA